MQHPTPPAREQVSQRGGDVETHGSGGTHLRQHSDAPPCVIWMATTQACHCFPHARVLDAAFNNAELCARLQVVGLEHKLGIGLCDHKVSHSNRATHATYLRPLPVARGERIVELGEPGE